MDRVFKFFGRSVTLSGWQMLLAACLVAFFVFLALFFLSGVDARTEVGAAPLEKNTKVKLALGERYVYVVRFENSTREEEYAVSLGHPLGRAREGSMCVRARVLNISANESFYEVCYYTETGEVVSALIGIGNETMELAEQTPLAGMNIIVFQPWMLALREGWVWQQNITTTTSALLMSLRRTLVSDYYVEGVGEIKGRRAFKVRIASRVVEEGVGRAGSEVVEWIDAEKRVLLYASGEGVEIELAEAPFELLVYHD
ncbi:MAG: hypothetical protein AB1468_01230 [Candidatus Micrarchaeota archaeon]